MARPLMPKATAVWLIENTSLTFDQVADYCGLHPLEIQAIADGLQAPPPGCPAPPIGPIGPIAACALTW